MMAPVDSIQAYTDLADELFSGQIDESKLADVTPQLPALNQTLLDEIGQHTEEIAISRPRRSWALAKVAYCAALAQEQSLFVQSLAAWYVGRASNHWAQPERVRTAISLARRGFVSLKESTWVAACDWQLNALAWTRSDLPRVVQTLSQALQRLEHDGFHDFVPDCRLALAYAQILVKEYEEAKKNIQLCEAVFIDKGDILNQARCWLYEANYLRREDQFDQAFRKLEQAARILETVDAPVDRARTHYYAGLCHLMKTENLPEATEQFRKAIELFSACDLELWRAMCVTNLGSVYLFTGDLVQADRHYEAARRVFVRYEINSLLADNLQDCGEVNILRGRSSISIAQFKQAADLQEKVGLPLPAAISITNLGKAYGHGGRYQDALYYLEQAAERLQSLGSPLRLGTCEKYTALIWSQLGQPAIAHKYLDRATHNYELANQNALLPEMYSYRASACFQQGMDMDAIQWLEKSLAVATTYKMRPQANLARRLLGEAFIRLGRYQDALESLKHAQEESASMGMLMDQAASFIACGECYALISEPEQARDAFEQASQLSQGAWPEIEWRAYIGLGDLAAARSNTHEALEAYRKGAEHFAQIRQNLWQPALVGSYFQKASQTFDRIISFASRVGSAHEALFLIEQGKASTFLRQLLARNISNWNPQSQEMNDLQAELGVVQDRLRSLREEAFSNQSTSESQQLRRMLMEKRSQYIDLKNRLERQKISEQAFEAALPDHFDLPLFRNWANSILQKNWLALDYYLIGNQLITIVIGPDTCEALSSPIPYRAVMALDACVKARQNPKYAAVSYPDTLGKLLIPDLLKDHLTPETYLLLAPHQNLHAVPWPALRPEFTSEPLVSVCIPVVVPSLQSLTLLWQRNRSNHFPGEESGLFVGVSQFHGRHRDLRHVNNEIRALRSTVGLKGQYLVEAEATWEHLLKQSQGPVSDQKEGLSRFVSLHIASHFFPDTSTGRLSGLALWDRDVWLDQLRDLVRLPRLVTISACSSSSSFVYEGDEHMDLPTTCMVAGADSVVGSIWPVADDQSAAELISAFYRYYLTGLGPARAAAQAQRELAELGAEEDRWASFICIGIP